MRHVPPYRGGRLAIAIALGLVSFVVVYFVVNKGSLREDIADNGTDLPGSEVPEGANVPYREVREQEDVEQ